MMDKVTTICYGQEQEWESRREAIDFFTRGVMGCEGSERDRYLTILLKLTNGEDDCADGCG